MKSKMMLVALAGLFFVSGCRVSDVRELTVQVPAMATQEDVENVKKALASLNGIQKDKYVVDLSGHTIKVTFDSMVIAHKNIEIAIAEAGYDANRIKAIKPPAAK